MKLGPKQVDITLEPVTGKALPVYKGQVLRIIQVEGEQCVDFNAFNLHDYKEHMSVGADRSRGFRLRKGDIIWSIQSRNRPMYYILEMPGTCVTDTLGGRCNARMHPGYWPHTNCMDTFAEAVGEYGLTPDDVHDSFNMWMNTEWDSTGRWWIAMNTGKAGDYVDLLALFDTLAVPIVCGSGDTSPTSNFWLKPIQVQVFEASDETLALVDKLWRKHGTYARSPEDFRIKDIKVDRELKPIPGYQQKWINYPLQKRKIKVLLSQQEYDGLQVLKERGLAKTDGETLRAAFFFYHMHVHRPLRIPTRGTIHWSAADGT